MTPAGPGCHLPSSPCPSMAGSLLTPALLQRSPWSPSPAPSSSGAGKEPTPHLWSSVGRDAPVLRNVFAAVPCPCWDPRLTLPRKFPTHLLSNMALMINDFSSKSGWNK